jgi:hypothetical protein
MLPFPSCHAVDGQPLRRVAINGVVRERNGIGRRAIALGVLLQHHIITDHPPRLPDIHQIRPSPVVLELIFCVAVGLHIGPDIDRHVRAGGEVIEQSRNIILMRLINSLATGIIIRRIGVIVADEIGGNIRVGVDIRLAVGDLGLHVDQAIQGHRAVGRHVGVDIAMQ